MKKYVVPGTIILSALLIVGVIMFQDSSGPETVTETTQEPRLEHVHGFAVDVSNDERLLIATHHGLMQFENNKLSKIGTVSDDLMGFTPHPSDPSVFFSSGHPTRGGNLGFQKSTDGGETWQKISDGLNGPVDFHSMTVSTVNPDLVYGHFGSLQHSKDGGKTWQIAKGQIQPYSLSTDPKREGVVYSATANGVMLSEDNGDTWKSYSTGLENGAVSVFAIDPGSKYALAFSQVLGGMGKTTDSGATWTKINESFGNQPVMFIAYSKTQTGMVYSLTQSNNIYKSTDEGSTWARIR
jgi:photosystem II stability/assembly factor-like uncharacterized protein